MLFINMNQFHFRLHSLNPIKSVPEKMETSQLLMIYYIIIIGNYCKTEKNPKRQTDCLMPN